MIKKKFYVSDGQKEVTIRFATIDDTTQIFEFINLLAEYEKLKDAVVCSIDELKDVLFKRNGAKTVFIEEDGQAVGFALFFYNFSTFVGKKGVYLEDLFVKQEFRGKGYGKALISFVASHAADEGCGRMEWAVLDWNKPSIEFYESLGAKPLSDWTVYRLTENELKTYKHQ